MAEPTPSKAQQPTPSAAPTTSHNTIYSYNHQNPHGPFAPGKLPKSLMILGGLMLFGSLYSFFVGSTQSTGWASFFSVVIGLIDILLAVGLLLRLEVARRVIVFVSIAAIVLTALSGLAVYVNMRQLDSIGNKAHEAIAQERQKPLSAEQEANLSKLEAQILEIDRGVILLKKRMSGLYIYWGFISLLHAGIAVYLTRPNIKSEFRKLQ